MKKFLCTVVLVAGLTTLGQMRVTPQPFVVPQKPATTNKVDFAPELEAATAGLKQRFDSGKTSETEMLEALEEVNRLIANMRWTAIASRLPGFICSMRIFTPMD